MKKNLLRIKNRTANIVKYINQKRLKNRNFTIISNDCWGGVLYKELNLEYTSPFIGLMLMAPCYIKMLKRLDFYLEIPLEFKEKSIYSKLNLLRETEQRFYPIGMLKDIEIHFFHYQNKEEVIDKWERRKERINWDNLFIKFAADKDECTVKEMEEFTKLDYPRKLCLTNHNYEKLNDNFVWLKEGYDGGAMYKKTLKYFDVIDWLNGGNGKVNFFTKNLHQLLLP